MHLLGGYADVGVRSTVHNAAHMELNFHMLV